MKPTRASNTPAATIPPRAAGMPPSVFAAATGAKKCGGWGKASNDWY